MPIVSVDSIIAFVYLGIPYDLVMYLKLKERIMQDVCEWISNSSHTLQWM